MSSYLHENFNYIHLIFKTPFFKEFKNIYFQPNDILKYYDHNHLNYIYKQTIDKIDYTFHGFYKDSYLIIVIDSFNQELETTIEHKELVIIKMDWELKKISKDKSLWILNIQPYTKERADFFILPLRKKILNNPNNILSIDDYLKIKIFNVGSVSFELIDEEEQIQSQSTYKNILSLMPLLFLFKISRNKRVL